MTGAGGAIRERGMTSSPAAAVPAASEDASANGAGASTTGHHARQPSVGPQPEPHGGQAAGGDSPQMPEGPSAAASGPMPHWQ
eukprot:13303954-Heterocapsa_arctica.AAC.1